MPFKLPKTYDYEGWNNLLGTRESRKIQRNTYVEWIGDLSIGIRLHMTHIVIYHPDGMVTFDTGGRWKTVTTKDRMNSYGPSGVRIRSHNNVWYVTYQTWDLEKAVILDRKLYFHPSTDWFEYYSQKENA